MVVIDKCSANYVPTWQSGEEGSRAQNEGHATQKAPWKRDMEELCIHSGKQTLAGSSLPALGLVFQAWCSP